MSQLQPPGSIVELCHVVADMDAAIARWVTTLRAGPFFVSDMRLTEGHRYRGKPALLAIRVGFGFSGGLLIELVQPLDGDESVFTEVLQRRGPSYHHVMLREDFDTAHARLSAHGYAVALESTTPMGERCALFDTGDGGFVEVMDLHRSFGRLAEHMAQAHAGWDGTAQKRDLGALFTSIMEASA